MIALLAFNLNVIKANSINLEPKLFQELYIDDVIIKI